MNERNFEILVAALKDILEEIKAMREDYAEGQAVYTEVSVRDTLSDIGSIEFNKKYEG